MSSPSEIQNRGSIAALLGRGGTDASVDAAIAKLDGSKADGVSKEELLELLKSGGDYGQLTEREYNAIRQWVEKNSSRLSPEAKEAFGKFDAAVQQAGGNPNGLKADVLGLPFGLGNVFGPSAKDKALLEGNKLENLFKSIEGKDSIDKCPPGQHPGHTVPPPPSSSSSPPSGQGGGVQGSGGAQGSGGVSGGSGMSWEAIFANIMASLDKLEKSLKERAMGLSAKIDKSEKAGKEFDTAMKEWEGKDPATRGEAPKAADFGDSGTEVSRTELANIQGDVQKINQMFTMLTNLMQTVHDTKKSAINNLRV
jgi:hypothetical protein